MRAGLAGTARRGLLLAGLVAALPLLVLWATGSLGVLALWAAEGQRSAQNALAGAVRALRGGDGGALAALIGLAFAYGVFHAAGPGHGKVLIGGYGVARRVRLAPLAALALVSSLAQATVAVALVYAGVMVFGWTRAAMVGAAEGAMLAASHLAVGLIGLWLAWRGGRGVWRAAGASAARMRLPQVHGAQGHHGHRQDHDRDHDHDHETGAPQVTAAAGHHHPSAAHGDHDPHCNHRHGPTPDEAAAVTGWREGAALVAGVAARPCSGALLLLVLTWQMGIGAAGVAGAYAMGLGTALVTVAVAGLSVWAREGALATLAAGRLRLALPVLELSAGLAIAGVSAALLAG